MIDMQAKHRMHRHWGGTLDHTYNINNKPTWFLCRDQNGLDVSIGDRNLIGFREEAEMPWV